MIENEIEISGSTRNLKILIDALALPRSSKSSGRGDNLEFPTRKVIVNKKFNGLLMARQVNGSVYSQVVCRSDTETPFVRLIGVGDVVFDMQKALQYIKELSSYENVSIICNKETHQITFRGIKDNTDCEEWYTFESSKEIDDARDLFSMQCDCKVPEKCEKCKGTGSVHIPPLDYRANNSVVPAGHPYEKIGVRFDIDTGIMRMIGDKTEALLTDAYPVQFNKDNLLVFIGTPGDVSNDSFKKQIPVSYAVNDMIGRTIIIGSDFRNVFGSLEGNITIFSEDTIEVERQSIYVEKNDIGFHTGVKVQAKMMEM